MLHSGSLLGREIVALRIVNPTCRCALLALLWLAVGIAPASAAQQAEADAAQSDSSAAKPSATADPTHLAQLQGACDSMVLDWVLANAGPLKGDAHSAGLRVTFTVTAAEGWWDNGAGGKLVWHDAPAGNMHLRIFVSGLADGRMLSGLAVHARLTDANGNAVSVPSDFGWYPLLNAYGGNLPLDADGSYSLHVTVEADSIEGRSEPVTVDFDAVEITHELLGHLPLATDISFAQEAELLRPGNAALSSAVTALWQQTASGAEQTAGDYFIGYAAGDAASITPHRGAGPHRATLHALRFYTASAAAIFPRDARTGRVIPGLAVRADLISADGKPAGGELLPFIHAPWFSFYEATLNAPPKAGYKLRVRFSPPSFRRWGRQGERFAAPVDVEFGNVSLK